MMIRQNNISSFRITVSNAAVKSINGGNTNMLMLTLKKVLKTCDCEKGKMITARNVVTPPFTMAGPRLTRAAFVRSVREPELNGIRAL